MKDTAAMRNATPHVQSITRLILTLLLLGLVACESAEEAEPTGAPGLAAEDPNGPMDPNGTIDPNGTMAGAAAMDTTRLRTTYESIEEHYRQMMARYEDMTGGMSPEARQLYDEIQQHYADMMPAGETAPHMMGRGMMEHGMMAGHMMAMHDHGTWNQQMLDLHQRMAQVHAQGDDAEMAELHEEMVRLHREALQDAPASGAGRTP